MQREREREREREKGSINALSSQKIPLRVFSEPS
jgi:hypothetical protein